MVTNKEAKNMMKHKVGDVEYTVGHLVQDLLEHKPKSVIVLPSVNHSFQQDSEVYTQLQDVLGFVRVPEVSILVGARAEWLMRSIYEAQNVGENASALEKKAAQSFLASVRASAERVYATKNCACCEERTYGKEKYDSTTSRLVSLLGEDRVRTLFVYGGVEERGSEGAIRFALPCAGSEPVRALPGNAMLYI